MPETVNLDALEALARAATPGPWTPYETVQADNVVTAGGGLLTGTIICGPTYEKTNTHFIAAASPDVVLALIEELRAARAGVVAEEPEWGVWDRRDRVFRHVEPPTEENARREAALGGTEFEATRALPWVPVKQEGAET